MKKEVEQIIHNKESIDHEEERRITRVRKRCNWEDPKDVSDYITSLRKRARSSKIPDDKVCPHCQTTCQANREWALIGDFVGCKTCWAAHKLIVDPEDTDWDLFTMAPRWAVDGRKLMLLREKLGLTRYAVATRCGWSYNYQYRIEVCDVRELADEHVNTIIDLFTEVYLKSKHK